MTITVYVVSTCIPERGAEPCQPFVFATEAEAEEFTNQMMVGEWEAAEGAPEGADEGPAPYPGDWRVAQEAIAPVVQHRRLVGPMADHVAHRRGGVMTSRFRVDLLQRVWEEATIIIEAADRDAAEAKAMEMADAGGIEWSFLEAPDPAEIVSVEETTL